MHFSDKSNFLAIIVLKYQKYEYGVQIIFSNWLHWCKLRWTDTLCLYKKYFKVTLGKSKDIRLKCHFGESESHPKSRWLHWFV